MRFLLWCVEACGGFRKAGCGGVKGADWGALVPKGRWRGREHSTRTRDECAIVQRRLSGRRVA